MKKFMLGIVLLAILFLGACSSSSTKKKSTNEKKENSSLTKKEVSASNLDEPIIVNGLELTIKQLKTKTMVGNEGKDKKSVYGVEISGKNIGSGASGLGAIDFVVTTTDGKEHKVDDNFMNFGDEIPQDKTLSGKAYFVIDKNQKIAQLQYKPVDKVLVSWNLKSK